MTDNNEASQTVNFRQVVLTLLTSRAFWVATAAFLASIASTVAGMSTTNETLTVIGLVCSIISGGITSGITAVQSAKQQAVVAVKSALAVQATDQRTGGAE